MKRYFRFILLAALALLVFSAGACSRSDDQKDQATDQPSRAMRPAATVDAPQIAEDAPQALTPAVEQESPQAPDFMDDAHKGQATDEILEEALPVSENRPGALAVAESGSQEPAAAGKTDGVIRMANPAYERHTRPIVLFSHAGHYSNYGISCGQCHHDAQGRPLTDLKEGDFVESCIACHSIPGEMPRDQKTALQGLPEAQSQQKLLAFHAEAIHKSCTDCHKSWNQEQGRATRDGAPTTCAHCHIRE